MNHPPVGLDACVTSIMEKTSTVEGWMADRELRFLALLAACPTGQGEILELGSYHGKSTIALAKGAELSGDFRMTTIDRMSPDQLRVNLDQAGVSDRVEIRQGESRQIVPFWTRPIRLLWHDGANDEAAVRFDLKALLPAVAEGGIVAMHDVLNTSGERIRCFVNDILAQPGFGAAGIVGSIGWAQRTDRRVKQVRHAELRQRLIDQLRPLIPYHDFFGPRIWPSKLIYKFKRARVPHDEPQPADWLSQVA